MSYVFRNPADHKKTKKGHPLELPHRVRVRLEECFAYDLPVIENCRESAFDHSVKCEVALNDGCRVEMVILPEKSRITLCVSTQVGCRQACGFCATGRMGLVRNLTAAEIVQQVYLAQRWLMEVRKSWHDSLTRGTISRPDKSSRVPGGEHQGSSRRTLTNLVFMGMGEPGDNVASVIQAISILIDPWAFGLAPRRITPSTAGHLDGLKTFYQAYPQIGYALSVHRVLPNDRRAIMPIEKRYPLMDVLKFMRSVSERDGKSFLIQYTLIKDVNDSWSEAEKLAAIIEGINAKINLLWLNPIRGFRHSPASESRGRAFAKCLRERGFRVMIRCSKAEDINGACGQLITQKK